MNRVKTNNNNYQNIGWKPPVPPSEKKPTGNRRSHLRQITVECDNVETRLSNLPTYTQEIWSKFGVLPSIKAINGYSLTDNQLRPERNITVKPDEELSYSKIRVEWMKMRRSGDLPQTIKDELHERYLQETTNYMNLLVFGVPDPGLRSVTSESEITGPQDTDPALCSGFVPKPPPGPRGSSDRRSATSEIEITGPQNADPALYSGFVPKPPPGPRGSSDRRSATSESEITGPRNALCSGFVPKPPPCPRGPSDRRHRRLRRGRPDVKPMEILSPVSEGPSPRAG